MPDLRDSGPLAAAEYGALDPVLQGKTPEAVVDLTPIFNKHWQTSDWYETSKGKVFLSVHFDMKGEPYLSVMPPGWSSPLFYEFGAGMAGAWRVGEEVHRLELDASIFRGRLNNLIEIDKDGQDGHLYKKKIISLLVKAFNAGKEVSIGGRPYRLFFSYALKKGNPSGIDEKSFGVVLVYDADPRGEHEFKPYIINYAELKAGTVGKYLLYEGQKVGLRVPPNSTELEFYDLR